MDYEKAYKEALERAKSLIDEEGFTEGSYPNRNACEAIFPELKEGEDERHRKWVLEYLYDGLRKADEQFKDHFKAAIDWLEKQKDITPIVVSNEDWDCQRAYSEGYQKGMAESNKKKPAKWKPQPESLEALMYAIEGKWDMISPTSYLSRRLEDLYEGLVNTFHTDEIYLDKLSKAASAGDIEELRVLKQKIDASMEQNAAEKQDYSGLTDFERAIHRGFLCAGVENVPVTIIKETAQDCLAQIKPAEWSEEDEDNLKAIIRIVEDNDSDWKELTDWLKSLRPSPSWKPSDEQMRALRRAVNKLAKTDVADSVRLSIMYDNLKKLM